MFGEPNKAQARLLKDAPHEHSKPTKDYQIKVPVVHNDDIENPVTPPPPAKGKAVEEKEEVIENRRK